MTTVCHLKFRFVLLIITLLFSQIIFSLNLQNDEIKEFLDRNNIKTYSKKPKFENKDIFKAESENIKNLIIIHSLNIESILDGYGGKIDLIALMDEELKIKDIQIISHNETPSFYNFVVEKNEYLKKFTGLNKSEDIMNVDAVTRATVTSEALKVRLTQLIDMYNQVSTEYQKSKIENLIKITGFLLIFTAFISSFFYNNISRKFVLFALFLISFKLGFLQYSFSELYNNIAGGIFFKSVFLIILTLIAGRFYCGYVCPFGFIQEVISKFSGKKHNVKIWLSYFLPAVFTIYLITAYSNTRLNEYSNVEILSSYRIAETNIILLILLVVILVLSYFIPRIYCIYICPLGFLLGLLRKISYFKTKLPSSCVNCMLCEKECPTGAIVKKEGKVVIEGQICIDCRNCVKNCKFEKK